MATREPLIGRPEPPGWITIRTPINPTIKAVHRRRPTISPRKIIDIIVTIKGDEKPIVASSGNCNKSAAQKLSPIAMTPIRVRKLCRRNRFVFTDFKPGPKTSHVNIKINPNRNL